MEKGKLHQQSGGEEGQRGLGGREDNMVTVNEIVLIIRPGGIIQTVIRLEQMSGSWIFFLTFQIRLL